jgi:uncharacterized protein (DUF2384 family)
MIEVLPPVGPESDMAKPRPAKRRFRAAGAVRATPEAVTRQAIAARLAFTALDGDAARAFLNTPHADLGGRPIDVAGESDAGLTRVTDVIATHSRD